MAQTLSIGARSTGTMRQEDIAEDLVYMAREVSETAPVFAELETAIEHRDNDEHEECDECSGDVVSEMIAEAIDVLYAYAPPFCYVGAFEHDPADFGVWPDMESIEEAIRTGERIDAETVVNDSEGVRIHVSEHGNVEIYSLETGESLIAIV